MILDYNSPQRCVAVDAKFRAFEVLSLSSSIPMGDLGPSLSWSGR